MRAERDGDDDRWALHASDRTLLGNKTGATRLGFAILLKMFQANGRFPYRLEEVPVAAVEAIASQIEVPAEAWRGYDWRSRAAATAPSSSTWPPVCLSIRLCRQASQASYRSTASDDPVAPTTLHLVTRMLGLGHIPFRCRRLLRDAETFVPTHRFWPNG